MVWAKFRDKDLQIFDVKIVRIYAFKGTNGRNLYFLEKRKENVWWVDDLLSPTNFQDSELKWIT